MSDEAEELATAGGGGPPDVSAVSGAEWAVLEALWAVGPATARQVAERAGPGRGWAAATVKTLLARLVEKRAAAAEADPADGRRFLYRAAVAPDQARRAASQSFLARVFAGDAAAGVLGLVEAADLSPEQLAHLRRTLKKAEKSDKKTVKKTEKKTEKKRRGKIAKGGGQ